MYTEQPKIIRTMGTTADILTSCYMNTKTLLIILVFCLIVYHDYAICINMTMQYALTEVFRFVQELNI